MKRALKHLPGCLILLSFSIQAEPETSAAGSPLIKANPARGWSAGSAITLARREFKVDGALMATDLRSIAARVGIDLIPSVHPWVEAGVVKADRDDFEGENGPTWAVGVDVNLVEFIVAGHPSMPRKKILRLGGEVSYRESESNFADADFSWSELLLCPRVSYVIDHRGGESWKGYSPTGSAFYGGLVISRTGGDLASASVEANRNFGFELGGRFRLSDGVVTELSGIFYGDKDRALHLGFAYHF